MINIFKAINGERNMVWGFDFTDIWVWIGFGGQFLFFSRFVVQWIVSERRGESVIPLSFWYLGMGGAVILFFYSLHRRDPVFTIGCGINFFIYFRNIILINRKRAVSGSSGGS